MIRCIACRNAELRSALVSLEGTVRGETYTVEMIGLVCPNGDYQTIEGADMPEFAKLLADRYRSLHGLLTSEEIRSRRKRLWMSQQQFANYVGVGVASVKRWEMGKIQEKRSDDEIRRKTDRPAHVTAARIGRVEGLITSTNTGCTDYIVVEARQPHTAYLGLRHPTKAVIPPYLAKLLNASTQG